MRPGGPVLFALAVLSIAACTFPDVTYSSAPEGGPSGEEASVDATPGEGSPEASADGSEDATVDVSEDRIADVVSDYVFEAAPDANPCDLDGDGYDSMACGGNDCCDLDPRAHPQQTAYFTGPMQAACNYSLSFDYNCNGILEGQHVTGLNCSSNNVLNCTGSGFTGDPGCGGQGQLVSCMPVALGCGQSTPSYTAQGCR